MTSYFIRRILLVIPTLLGITLLVFGITRFVPGGPVDQMIMRAQSGGSESGGVRSSRSGQALDDAQLEELRAFYGFDKPVHVSYLDWLGKTLQFDLGVSTRYQEPVSRMILERLPVTLGYGAATLVLLYLVCIPLGILKAMRHGGIFDSASSVVLFFFQSVPSFVVGIFLLITFASRADLFPMAGHVSDGFEDLGFFEKIVDIFWHGTLPILSYLLGLLALLTFLMKNALLENLSADYVRTAMAKGVGFKQAVLGHALRNSLVTLAPYLGASIGLLVGGSFLIETIFTIDGIGLLGYDALVQRDYPTVMGILMLSAGSVLAGNLISDFILVVVDPRVKLS